MSATLSKGLHFDLASGLMFKSGSNATKFAILWISQLTEDEIESALAYFDLYTVDQLIDFLGISDDRDLKD